MIFIAAAAAVFAVLFIQYRFYKKHCFDHVVYSAAFSSDEVYAGDDIYLYEEISNTGRIPLPYIKIDSELPDGLFFTLIEEEREGAGEGAGEKKKPAPRGFRRSAGAASAGGESGGPVRSVAGGTRSVRYDRAVKSVFILRPHSKIRRRWRIICRKRGEYRMNGVVVTATDLLGFSTESKLIPPDDGRRSRVVVLTLPEELDGRFASSRYICGDAVSNICPVTDPLRIVGSREYAQGDPMNRINWKSTAVHGRLMVNREERTVRHRFSILLNMNSREIEQRPDTPSDIAAIERCNIICASVLSRIAAEDVPVRIFTNYPPDRFEGSEAVSADEIGSKIAAAGPYRGRRDLIFALRALAKMDMTISVPAEKMFDHIIANRELYRENENLVVISSYLDGRMINLKRAMEDSGVNVVFYIATTRNNIGEIPEDTDVYFRL